MIRLFADTKPSGASATSSARIQLTRSAGEDFARCTVTIDGNRIVGRLDRDQLIALALSAAAIAHTM